jgi:hypothetical protein
MTTDDGRPLYFVHRLSSTVGSVRDNTRQRLRLFHPGAHLIGGWQAAHQFFGGVDLG